MTKYLFARFLLFVCISTFLFACQRDPSFGTGNPPTPSEPAPDLSTKVVAGTISGFITDENDQPVQSADVVAGGKNTTTDKYGYFAINAAQVTENAATVSINKTGYFKAIKTFIAETGKSVFFRIKLLPKTNAGTFTASAGGTINITGGTSIAFPTNAVINKATNAAYTGTVTVLAKPISAADPDLNRLMPGDLRGLNTDNNLRILTTYGMIAVELTGAGGEALQIATGKKATITMPIPVAMQSEAPATITLWYFDEAKGLWIEEGKATKTGNNYVGEVSHFSYWNYDVPANYVKFKCVIVNQNNKPVTNAFVKISVVGKNNVGYGYTDSSGYTGGAIPNNAQLLMEVFSGSNCNTVLYSKSFATTTTNVDLGTLTVNIVTYEANITGTLINCNDQPVSNGFVLIKAGNVYYRHPVTNGSFNFNLTACTLPVNAIILAEDINAQQQNIPTTYTIKPGSNVLGNLKACGFSTEQFIRYTINDTAYNFSNPADTLDSYTGNNRLYLSAYRQNYSDGVSINFNSTGIALGTLQPLQSFTKATLNDTLRITTPINVTITEYGNTGEYISGNFNGTFNGANKTYVVACSFRVRREF